MQPRWRRDGKELFYVSPNWKLMAVEVRTQPVFQACNPKTLFPTDMVNTGIRTGPMSSDIAPDGNRFLIINDPTNQTSPTTVVLNWQTGLRK